METRAHGTASIDTRQFAELAATVIQQLPRDIPPTIAQRWIENRFELQRVLRNALLTGQATEPTPVPTPALVPVHPEPTTTAYPITVDYGQTVAQTIKAGKYDWVDGNINQKSFPHNRKQGKAELTVELVHFSRIMDSDKVVEALDQMGLRPATLVELCALGAQHPELQRSFPIVALGSVWNHPLGGRGVSCLGRNGTRRILNLSWWNTVWRESCRFAGIRK